MEDKLCFYKRNKEYGVSDDSGRSLMEEDERRYEFPSFFNLAVTLISGKGEVSPWNGFSESRKGGLSEDEFGCIQNYINVHNEKVALEEVVKGLSEGLNSIARTTQEIMGRHYMY